MAKSSSGQSGHDSQYQHLGDVYAKALLGVTEAAKNTEAVLDEFDSLVQDVLDRLPDFDGLLCSPRVSHAEKEALLDRAFGGRMSGPLLNFLKVVSRHGRLDCLRAMRRSFKRLIDELRGRVAVRVTTAHPLTAEEIALVGERLQARVGREVVLNSEVDPDVLGGIVVRIGDTVYDGSVRNQLERMRQDTMSQTLDKLRRDVDRVLISG